MRVGGIYVHLSVCLTELLYNVLINTYMLVYLNNKHTLFTFLPGKPSCLLTLMLFQPRKTFVNLRNTN